MFSTSSLPSLGASSPSGVRLKQNKARVWKPMKQGVDLLPKSITNRPPVFFLAKLAPTFATLDMIQPRFSSPSNVPPAQILVEFSWPMLAIFLNFPWNCTSKSDNREKCKKQTKYKTSSTMLGLKTKLVQEFWHIKVKQPSSLFSVLPLEASHFQVHCQCHESHGSDLGRSEKEI